MLRHLWLGPIFLALACFGTAWAQEQPAQEAAPDAAAQTQAALLSPEELEALVAPIAFYPDEVLAVTLPAATYPLDVVEAVRFLEQKKTKPDAQPKPDWDPSVLSLLNYPVVLSKMNENLDWTTSLGEAILNQQSDVIDAIQQVRRSAFVTGNLKSDERMTVTFENEVVKIAPADPKAIYIPQYETASAPMAEPAAEQAPVEQAPVEQAPVEQAQAPVEQAPAEQAQAPAESVTQTTNVYPPPSNYYYPSNVAYSQPYTPYYDSTASFWTGALVGGVTMGFLMNWDDDDIDIDFDEGDFEDWHPGRGNIEGDVNIGNEVNIGNGNQVAKGDSWRKVREQRTGGERTSQLKSTRAANTAAKPIGNIQQAPRAQQSAATANANRKPAQAAKTQTNRPKQTKKPNTVSRQQPTQKAGALGNVEPGQSTVKASKRGANSQQKATNKQAPNRQQTAPTKRPNASATTPTRKPTAGATAARPQQRNQSAFGNMSSGKQAKQSSNRGSSSRGGARPTRR
jgi:uncharacterized protein DUF3300